MIETPSLPMEPESIFTWSAVPVKFGAGAIDEVDHEARRLGLGRVLLLTDTGVVDTGLPDRVLKSLRGAGLVAEAYAEVRCEPTDESIEAAVDLARQGGWDGYVALGGGSVIDTAKAVNLLATHGGRLQDYVNPPIGAGREPPGPLKPLIAVPTTAGTGSESTPVCILDVLALRVKTGISHPLLRPTCAVVDPLVTLTLPASVTAACGMDVCCHALESYTARPYTQFPARRPSERSVYCGANPISDAWAERALQLLGRSLRRAVHEGDDRGARTDMMMAATFAGMGFGNAGVHLPHACSYPIAGRVRGYRPTGYRAAEPMVPHGQAVSLTAPAAFRFTYETSPGRHLEAARLLAGEAVVRPDSDHDALSSVLVGLMRDIEIPSGIEAVGYRESDVEDLADGAMSQARLLSLSPRPVAAEDVAQLFRASLANW